MTTYAFLIIVVRLKSVAECYTDKPWPILCNLYGERKTNMAEPKNPTLYLCHGHHLRP